MRFPVIPEALDSVRIWLNMGRKVFVVSAVDGTCARTARNHTGIAWLEKGAADRHVQLGSMYQAIKRLQPRFFADDLWKHCWEARDAGIDKMFRMHGGHDGRGSPIPGVPTLENLGGIRFGDNHWADDEDYRTASRR